MGLFGPKTEPAPCPIEVALGFNVWLVAQDRPREQRDSGHYVAGMEHTQKMPPELCRRMLSHARLRPGAVVCDSFMGIGTTGVEARLMGHTFFGCDVEKRWLEAAHRNMLATDQSFEGPGPAYSFWHGRAQELAAKIPEEAVDLHCFSPPYGDQDPLRDSSGRTIVDRAKSGENFAGYLLHSSAYNEDLPTPSEGSMSGLTGDAWANMMLQALRAMRRTLKPGGFIMAALREYRTDAGMVDLPGVLMRLAPEANLIVHDQLYAIEAAVDRFGVLTSRAGVYQHALVKRQARQEKQCGLGIPAVTRVVVLKRRAKQA